MLVFLSLLKVGEKVGVAGPCIFLARQKLRAAGIRDKIT